MYNNPLITIPRLQHNPNDAGYSHSHPHSEGATSGRFQGGPTGGTGDTTSRVAPDPNYKKPVLQQGVDKTSTYAPRGPMQEWAQDYEARKQVQFQMGGGDPRVGGEYGWGGKGGGWQDKFSWLPGISKKSAGDPRDPNIGMGEMIGGEKVGKISPDLVSKVMDDAQPEGVVTPEQIAQAAPSAQANASPQAVNNGQSTIAPQAPSYIGQADSQFAGGEEEFQATIQAQEDRAGKDISFGQAEGYGAKTAAPPAATAVTADVAEAGEWWESSGFFSEGQKGGLGNRYAGLGGRGEAWTQEGIDEVMADFRSGGYWGKEGKGDIPFMLGDAIEQFGRYDKLNLKTAEDLQFAIKSFYKGTDWGASKGLTDNQKRELVYREIKGMLGEDSDVDINTFMKTIDPTMTDEQLAEFETTGERMEEQTVGQKKVEAAELSTGTADFTNKVAHQVNELAQGRGSVSSLVSTLQKDIDLPDSYQIVRDSTGMPIVQFRGTPTGKMEKLEDGTERESFNMAKGRLSADEEMALNNALQSREQGQAAIQQHISDQLGLEIERSRADIVSAEFTQSLEMQEDQFGQRMEFDKLQFESNNSLAEANVTGIFGDAPTLQARELMGRLAWQIQTGTRNEFDPEGGFTQVPIMSDTVEMRKMRADLLGRFENQPTINREQFEAAVSGYMANKGPTFAREQWEAQQANERDAKLLAAGQVVTGRYKKEVKNERTGEWEEREEVTHLKSLEARRVEIDEKLKEAQLNGLRTIAVRVLDDEGKATGRWDDVEVGYLEQMRTDLDQQRLTHMMKMEEAAQLGIMDVDGTDTKTLAGQAQAVQERGMSLEERKFAAEQAALAGQAFQVDPTTGEFTGEQVDALSSENVQNRMRAQALEDQRGGLEQRGMATDTSEGVQYARQNEEMRRDYVSTLNGALGTASVEDTSGLEAALASTLPPSPAGMVWDGQGGVFKLRAGYEGRDIDPMTQREIEKAGPIYRARDRAERVLRNLQDHKFNIEATERARDSAQRNLREALADGNINTAEEEAYNKQVADRKLVEAQTKNEKYTMLFQLLQNPTALGMARRYGVLQQIEQDIGMQIPNVPESGPADTIPNINEWQTMNQEERAFRASLYASETGGSPEQFFEMIGRTAPAEIQQLQYGVL